MTSHSSSTIPGLASFVKSLKNNAADQSVEHLMLLLKRRQIYGSRQCAVAVTHLFLRLVAESKYKNVIQLLERIRGVGRRLIGAQPRELVIGNIVRRVLGLVREVSEVAPEPDTTGGQTTVHPTTSLGNTFSTSVKLTVDNGAEHGKAAEAPTMKEVKEDMLNGLREMLDELDQADEQIAGYALEHINANEVVLTYTSSLTAQKFLLSAAKRRKFAVIHVEGYPNLHEATHDTILNGRKREDDDEKNGESRFKSLIAAGINVTVIPDSAIFTIMSRVHKVILPAQIVLSNGGLIAASGTDVIAKAAKAHRVPVIALAAVYKHSPTYPFDLETIIGLGDPGQTADYRDGQFVDEIDVINPVSDYVGPEFSDVVISNIGAFAPSFVYQIVADHYRAADVDLKTAKSP